MTLAEAVVVAAGLISLSRLMELYLTFARMDRKERESRRLWAEEQQHAQDVWEAMRGARVVPLEKRRGN